MTRNVASGRRSFHVTTSSSASTQIDRHQGTTNSAAPLSHTHRHSTTRDRRISIRGQIVAKKFTDEENRTARKSLCKRTAVSRGHSATTWTMEPSDYRTGTTFQNYGRSLYELFKTKLSTCTSNYWRTNLSNNILPLPAYTKCCLSFVAISNVHQTCA